MYDGTRVNNNPTTYQTWIQHVQVYRKTRRTFRMVFVEDYKSTGKYTWALDQIYPEKNFTCDLFIRLPWSDGKVAAFIALYIFTRYHLGRKKTCYRYSNVLLL
jgi:hypothetical protein